MQEVDKVLWTSQAWRYLNLHFIINSLYQMLTENFMPNGCEGLNFFD